MGVVRTKAGSQKVAKESPARFAREGTARDARWGEQIAASGAMLDALTKADMMSDMKIFTVRDLDRRPGEVLEACDAQGEARIRRRDGRTYVLKAEAPAPGRIAGLPDFAARRRKLFARPLSRSFARKLDQAVAGE